MDFKQNSNVSAASQQLESVCDLVRHASGQALAAMHLVAGLRRRPAITKDRNGRGDRYLKLRYRPATRRGAGRRSFYLGHLNEPDLQLLTTHIECRWSNHEHRMDEQLIEELRSFRNSVRRVAVSMAARAGFRFRGYNLHRSRGEGRHGNEDNNSHYGRDGH